MKVNLYSKLNILVTEETRSDRTNIIKTEIIVIVNCIHCTKPQ